MNVIIRNEWKEEQYAVERMIREAFWNVYKPGCDEHLMVNQLHQVEEFIPELDFVAECEGKIVGNIVCSYCRVDNEIEGIENGKDIIAIGPIGVLPECQKQGIGRLLIEAVKKKSLEMGIAGIVLYGDPGYYSQFGFVNAKEYGICTPQGANFDAFMALELSPGSLRNIAGRCYESKAFEIDMDILNEFEKNFIEIKIDYSVIEKEFEKVDKKFPLKKSDQIGLTIAQAQKINPCGTYCDGCEDYGVVCDGCRNRNGMPLWYHLYDKKEPCCYFQCCENKGKHDCSQCDQLPCDNFFEYPDPNMSNDFKQWWFKLRMDNFNKLRETNLIEVEDDFEKNVRKYRKDNN